MEGYPLDPQRASRSSANGTNLSSEIRVAPAVGIVAGAAAFVLVIAGVMSITNGSGNGQVAAVAAVNTPVAPAPVSVPSNLAQSPDGRMYPLGEVVVTFKSDTLLSDAVRLINSVGGTVNRNLGGVPIFLVNVPDMSAQGVMDAVAKFQSMKEVLKAEPNYTTPK